MNDKDRSDWTICHHGLAFAVTVAISFWIILFAATAHGQTFTVLHDFQGGIAGQFPQTGLTMDAGGNFYGTAGQSLVFRLAHRNSGWVLNPLHSFMGPPDGLSPAGRAVFGPNGTLYGATSLGGIGGCEDGEGCGTVYNIQPPPTVCLTSLCPWQEQLLYRFTQNPNDGVIPTGDPVFDDAGNMYGTTNTGGLQDAGIAYTLSPTSNGWVENIIYYFSSDAGVVAPLSGFVRDSSGNLYGTAGGGSDNGCSGYCGTVYELTPSGSQWTLTVLHQFDGSDGSIPKGTLIADESGNLYGTTEQGGPNGGGTAYELENTNGQWTFHLLYAFSGGVFDIGPSGPLFRDASGNLYGLTANEGAYDMGTIFRLTPSGGSWTYTDLHDFAGGANDGAYPYGNPLLDSQGNIFGTAGEGGTGGCPGGCGLVWELTP